ncbi:MAG: hypothetical protein AAF772_11160 [Acidobacteriota bacterium]
MSLAVALLWASPATSNTTTLLTKPDQRFLFVQSNVAGGYDQGEPDDGYGLADRGPRTQVTFEWLVKDEARIQRGYTRLLAPSAWNLKFGFELDPAEASDVDPALHFRLFDVWVQLGTKWDRTSLRVGHRSLPYGSNPRLDPEFDFLPNQASLDLGISRDTGVFFSTPVSPSWDLRVSATMGGFLSGPLASIRDLGGESETEGNIDYRGTWLGVVDFSTPNFRNNDVGFFAAVGKMHRAEGALTEIARLGGYWVHKHRERWKTVHQLSVGRNDSDALGERDGLDVLNNVEFVRAPRWSVGLSQTFRLEDLDDRTLEDRRLGTVLSSLSYRLTHQMRVRLNAYVEYEDSVGEREHGVLLQICTGCGLRK